MQQRSRRGLPAVLAGLSVLSAGVLALSGCASSTSAAAPAASAGVAKGRTVIAVGGPLSDPFFGAVQKGGQDAATQLGASFSYTAPTDFSNGAADLARLLNEAIAKKPSVIVVGDFIPPAEDPIIKKAAASGIAVVLFNSGVQAWQADGAIGFFGEDPVASGTAAGQAEAKAGVKSGLCVDQIPENPVLGVRCTAYAAALKAAGGSGATLDIPSTDGGDAQKVTQTLTGYLRSHPDVNGIFTLGTAQAVDAETAAAGAGRTVQVGTTDVSLQVLNDVKSGKLLFSIDQQPYLQMYDAVIAGLQDSVYGMHGTSALTTSPLVITKDTAQQVIDVQQRYGVRGAK